MIARARHGEELYFDPKKGHERPRRAPLKPARFTVTTFWWSAAIALGLVVWFFAIIGITVSIHAVFK